MGYTILIAEDDMDIIEVIKLYLESNDIRILKAINGEEALEVLNRERVDMAILDIMMPKMNGYELTRKIRDKMNIPIIIISAKDQSADKVLGLNLGADDYVTKPFDPLEFSARVNAQLRRYYKLGSEEKKVEGNIIKYKDLKLDTDGMVLFKGDERIETTAIEYKILGMLLKSPGRIFTKAQIYENIHGDYFESDENTLMVHISNLRNKLHDNSKEQKYIKTIRGLGYKIEKEEIK